MEKPKKQPRALTMQILGKGISGIKGSRLHMARMKAALLTGVAFMTRVCELIPRPGTTHFLRRKGVEFEYGHRGSTKPTGMRVTIQSQKTNGEPVWRSIGATWTNTCCVRAMYEYLHMCGDKPGQNESVFGACEGLKALGYKDVMEGIRAAANSAGCADADEFSTKSMRRGGVTTMTEKGNVPGYIIGKHGRWSSLTWASIYEELNSRTAKMIAENMH